MLAKIIFYVTLHSSHGELGLELYPWARASILSYIPKTVLPIATLCTGNRIKENFLMACRNGKGNFKTPKLRRLLFVGLSPLLFLATYIAELF